MTSISETLFDTYGDSLMQEYAPYDEAEILAVLDRMSMPQDMQIQVCDLLSSRYLRWGTAAFSIMKFRGGTTLHRIAPVTSSNRK